MRFYKTFMEVYKHGMRTGWLNNHNGLCWTMSPRNPKKKLLYFFKPVKNRTNLSGAYWAYGKRVQLPITSKEVCGEFTPLRQTICLFCAAMNGELKK